MKTILGILMVTVVCIVSCVPPATVTQETKQPVTVVKEAPAKLVTPPGGISVTYPIPTPWFDAIYCANPSIDSIYNGDYSVYLRVGDTIKAYDPQGVLCGKGVLNNNSGSGRVILPFMPIYGDDYTTPNVDEGAKEGDTITFGIVHNDLLPPAVKYREYICTSIPPLIWHYQDIVERCSFRVKSCCTKRGDIDGDNNMDIADLSMLLNFLFINPGEGITCLSSADFNADNDVDIVDVTEMIAYMFQDGPPPSSIPCK